jgi:hypothetical protein
MAQVLLKMVKKIIECQQDMYVLTETDEIDICLVSCHVPFVELFKAFLDALLHWCKFWGFHQCPPVFLQTFESENFSPHSGVRL